MYGKILSMKVNVHPQWFEEAAVSCVCGATFKTGSTRSEIRVDICSRCHPFYTGEMRLADAEGKVDRFVKKMEKAKAQAPILAQRKAKKAGLTPQEDTGPKSLKEMLLGVQ